MAMPAQKIDSEVFVEERVARLEANVEHIQFDISEMKTDIREIRSEMKEMHQSLSSRIDSLRDSLASLALSTEKSFAAMRVSRMADRVWWLLMSAGLLAVMARGFKWL